jgi:hypothetical protein
MPIIYGNTNIEGNLETNQLRLINGASAGYILQSDSQGFATWTSSIPGTMSSASIETVTVSSLSALITSEDLIPGTFYKITDAQTVLYGGTEIVLQANSTTTLNPKGIGKFYNPIYTGAYNGVWNKYAWFDASSLSGDFNRGETVTSNNGAIGTIVGIVNPSVLSQSTFFLPVSGDWTTSTSITGDTTGFTASITNVTIPSYSIGDKVNWGGRVWINLTGNVGDGSTVNTFTVPKFANPYSLDSTNWAVIPYDEVDYVVEWDEITYDVENDFITFRRDSRGNKVEQSYSNFVNSTGDYAIKLFQWGNDNVIDNICENSLFETVNHMGGNIYGNRVNGDSFINGCVFGKGFVMFECEFKTYTIISRNFFYSTIFQMGLYYMSIGELSEINNSEFTNSLDMSYSTMNSAGITHFSVSNLIMFYCNVKFGYLRNFRAFRTLGFPEALTINQSNFLGGGIRFSTVTGGASSGIDTYKDVRMSIIDMNIGGNNTLSITPTSTVIFNPDPTKRIYRRPNGTFGITYLDNTDTVVTANANS